METVSQNAQRVYEFLNDIPGMRCQPAMGGIFLYPCLLLPDEIIQEAEVCFKTRKMLKKNTKNNFQIQPSILYLKYLFVIHNRCQDYRLMFCTVRSYWSKKVFAWVQVLRMGRMIKTITSGENKVFKSLVNMYIEIMLLFKLALVFKVLNYT